MTTLRYLDFDYSEDTEGIGTFDAMASTAPDRIAEVQAEIDAVIRWAESVFPDTRGALADGADWDADLQELDDGPDRRTLVLSLSGSEAFCEALRERFGL
ncbi:hypothetical protein [Variovorax sp. PAMC 28711]|uniref:hypothetical protein n=1 Tax=Variovorax sp. PAMC 28711 TaxID=1795631 RepID=UPI00078C54C9|nr:hypothetical protein [Variovorax sp. PAMC 28711]AMM26098.1 hypothetical protein AX767_18355 [Variovorax sp. PAMC 28711]